MPRPSCARSHRWTYKNDGELMGAPHFPQNPCLHLNKSPLQNWNGLLFSGKRDIAKDLAKIGVMKDLDFSGYMLDRIQVDEYAFNWKTFIEVYLEDYHVVPFHPGLGNFVDCDDLKWQFGEQYSVQTVGISNALRKVGSPVYGKWQEQVLRYYGDKLPKYGAIWLTYYPNITGRVVSGHTGHQHTHPARHGSVHQRGRVLLLGRDRDVRT